MKVSNCTLLPLISILDFAYLLGFRLFVSRAEIEADRENLKDSVFRIKHAAEWLYDAGDSMIGLEHVRALLADPPAVIPGKVSAFCDFAGPGDESVLAVCEGNSARVVEAWRHRDTMHSVGLVPRFKPAQK